MLSTTEDKLLARNSSRRYDSQLRWTELAIYQTADGYRVVITGKSAVPGEEERVRIEETPSADVVVEACAPRDESTGRNRLTWVSRKTLLEAALVDEDIAGALEDWEAANQ